MITAHIVNALNRHLYQNELNDCAAALTRVAVNLEAAT